MTLSNIKLLFLLLCALSSNSWGYHVHGPQISELSDIKEFNKSELRRMKSRYPNFQQNPQLFSADEFEVITAEDLSETIKNIILHKKIKLTSADDLILFARQVKNSGFTFKALELRMNHYLAKGELVFTALNKAIVRERFHRWKIRQNKKVVLQQGPFIKSIHNAKLTKFEENKLINAYGVCIQPFTVVEDRNNEEKVKPRVCGPDDEYPEPRHQKHSAHVRQTRSARERPRTKAYDLLLREAKKVVTIYELNRFEQIKMARCIADQALRFFEPEHHPFSAAKKLIAMNRKSQEDAYFMHRGVCGNFSGIAFNIAHYLDPDAPIFLAKSGPHVYIEFEVAGMMYHTHPFNRKSRCDINRYKTLEEIAEEKR